MYQPSWDRALRLLTLALAGALLAAGCGDPAPEAEKPVFEPVPSLPTPTYEDNHLRKAQRGVAIDDRWDQGVVQDDPVVGISAARLAEDFGLLVINRQYVEGSGAQCVRSADAERIQPRQSAERTLGELEAVGVRFDRVAVNVDLLSPDRAALLSVCFDSGADSAHPRFGTPEHRRRVLDAFRSLAGLPGLAYITVGLEMNQYYHVRTADGRVVDDYSNYVTLYREIYDAIKAVNADIKVGPGISWAVFMTQSVPEIGAELGLDDPRGPEAIWRAYLRTIRPLLKGIRTQPRATADFIGISMLPFFSQPPFDGTAAPAAGGPREKEILAYYQAVALVAGDLPVVLPQVDWPETGAGSRKAEFLTILKRALSGVQIEWAAWRRLSDVPRRVAGVDEPPCAAYTELGHGEDYCTSGLLSATGERREVLEVFTTDP